MPLRTAFTTNAALIPADALRGGTRLEDYEIDCVIARSAVSMVYRARDRRDDQLVAIKEFLPIGLALRGAEGQVAARETLHEPTFQRGRQIFLEQARALEACDHASLMRVLRVMECHDTVYKVMPYCQAPTLLDFRQQMAAAPTERVLRSWLDGLMGALAQFHDQGQLHGAVSPGNILMLPGDRPVLLDSDAVHAAILSEHTRSMIASLEPCFAPQEQCDPAPDRPLGPWTDLYALAATLRFSASGQLPGAFAQRAPGGPVGSGARRHGSATEPAGADAPAWLASLDACLADAGKDRPQSLAQLKTRLQAGREPSPAAKAGPARLLSTPLVGSPAMAALGAEKGSAPPSLPTHRAARDAAPVPLQQPLPLVMPSLTATVAEGDDPVDRAAAQPDTHKSFSDPTPAEAVQPATSGARDSARSRSRWHMAAIATVLVLAVIALLSIPRWKEAPRPGPDAPATPTAGPSPSSPLQRAATTGTVPATAPREAVAPVALPPSGKPVAPAGALAVHPAAPSPTPSKPAAKAEKGAPVAPKKATNPPVAPSALSRASSPRQACAGRERYALLQCMNEQCAKSVWTKHEQCVRLRRDKKL